MPRISMFPEVPVSGTHGCSTWTAYGSSARTIPRLVRKISLGSTVRSGNTESATLSRLVTWSYPTWPNSWRPAREPSEDGSGLHRDDVRHRGCSPCASGTDRAQAALSDDACDVGVAAGTSDTGA